MSTNRDEEISNGWTLEKESEMMCHFEHIPLERAKEIIEGCKQERPSVVETINWTLAEERSTVHYNKYFTWCFDAAIAKAVEIELASKQVAEEVFCVRIASDDEGRSLLKSQNGEEIICNSLDFEIFLFSILVVNEL